MGGMGLLEALEAPPEIIARPVHPERIEREGELQSISSVDTRERASLGGVSPDGGLPLPRPPLCVGSPLLLPRKARAHPV